MDINMIACMQNVMGLFVQYIYLGQYDRCAELFAHNNDCRLHMPDEKRNLTGCQNINQYFYEQQRAWEMKKIPREIYILNTPAFSADNEKGRGMWLAFTFKYLPENKASVSVEPSFYRFDCDFVIEDDMVKISTMKWYRLMNWTDWKCSIKPAVFSVENVYNAPVTLMNAQDFVEIENIVSRFTHTYMKETKILFSENACSELLLSEHMSGKACGYDEIVRAAEKLTCMDEDELLCCVPYTTAPVININNERARAQWLTMSFDLVSNTDKKAAAVRRIGIVDGVFIKENGKWKILKYNYNVRESFQPSALKFTQCYKHWRPAAERFSKPAAAEDIFEIQSIMPQWTERLKIGRLQEFVPRYMSENKEELFFWLGDDEKRIIHGYDGVMEDCRRMDDTYHNSPYKTPIIHSAMTPLIEISDDGTMAYAQWMDQCCTDTSQITGNYTMPFPAMVSGCKYQHIFRKEHGHWRLLKFMWNAWFSMEDIYADPASWSGWVALEDEDWPMPLE